MFFGYEDGDTGKRVDLIFVGVLNDFVQDGNLDVDEGDVLKIKNYGIKIENPESNKSKKKFLQILGYTIPVLLIKLHLLIIKPFN